METPNAVSDLKSKQSMYLFPFSSISTLLWQRSLLPKSSLLLYLIIWLWEMNEGSVANLFLQLITRGSLSCPRWSPGPRLHINSHWFGTREKKALNLFCLSLSWLGSGFYFYSLCYYILVPLEDHSKHLRNPFLQIHRNPDPGAMPFLQNRNKMEMYPPIHLSNHWTKDTNVTKERDKNTNP